MLGFNSRISVTVVVCMICSAIPQSVGPHGLMAATPDNSVDSLFFQVLQSQNFEVFKRREAPQEVGQRQHAGGWYVAVFFSFLRAAVSGSPLCVCVCLSVSVCVCLSVVIHCKPCPPLQIRRATRTRCPSTCRTASRRSSPSAGSASPTERTRGSRASRTTATWRRRSTRPRRMRAFLLSTTAPLVVSETHYTYYKTQRMSHFVVIRIPRMNFGVKIFNLSCLWLNRLF